MQSPLAVPVLLQELASFASVVRPLLSSPTIDWSWQPDAASWSLTEVMCHLRDVEEEVHMVRYRAILARDNPFLPGASTDEWAVIRCYQAEDGLASRDAFLSARHKSLAMLSELDETSWQRKGRHAFFGPTTLREMVNLAVQHDQLHLQQIEDLLANNR
jgi:hypothetical protein